MMTPRIFLTLMLAAVVPLHAISSDDDTREMKWRPLQVTFIMPVGSNGLHAWKTGNYFSLNMLFGMNGAVNGVELSGLAGLLKEGMNGAQFAGLLNTAGGDVKGFQAAGLLNVAAGNLTGAQIAGLVNVAARNGRGFQAAGLVNIAAGNKVSQVSGLFNYAKTVHGVQIGLFNYADTVEKGIPIGLFSIVRHGGYHAFELTAGETFYGAASFKLGVRKFYSIFSAGAAYRNDMLIWGWGVGYGTLFQLGKKLDLSLEGICYQVNLGEWFTHGPNLLAKVNLSLGWQVARRMALVFTPSWNVTVMDLTDEYGEPVKRSFAPYWVYNKTLSNNMNLKMYPGLSIGIRF